MKVFVKGKGEVTLTSHNFVAEGGQASVYQKNGTAYKVYTEPGHAIPEAKFLELAPIADPNVIRPDALLLSGASSDPVGYTMRFVENTLSLCQLFPRVFRERRGLDGPRVFGLVHRLRACVEAVHGAHAVIVDLNELNVLVSDALDDVFLIDVDSYQTKSFRAEVIMPSVRDWSVTPKQFSELSDWYSFAILAFQMYVGIHPYKGSHAKTAHLPPAERLEARMRQNLSALGTGVSLPKACYPLDSIPDIERAWMRAVLDEGKRVPPPDPSKAVPVVSVKQAEREQSFGASLSVHELFAFEESVVGYAVSGARELVLTGGGDIYLGRRRVAQGFGAGIAALGFSPKSDEPVALALRAGDLFMWDKTGTVQKIGSDVSELAKSGDRFYVRIRDRVLEVEFWEKSGALTASATHVVANVLESACRLFEGCAVQNMLGSAFVSLFPKSHMAPQVRMPELDKYRVVEAKFEGGVLMVVGAKAGEYDRLVFRFDEEYRTYDTKLVPNVTPAGLNFLVTASGLCVVVTEDEKLEAFLARKDAVAVRVVEDPAIGGDMRLLPIGGRVGFSRGKVLFSMTLT